MTAVVRLRRVQGVLEDASVQPRGRERWSASFSAHLRDLC